MGRYAELASSRIPPAQVKRRDRLFEWLQQRESGVTAAEVVEWSSIYAYLHGRQEKCSQDMRALAKVGLVTSTDERRNPYWIAAGTAPFSSFDTRSER